ncbi:hypothetical protein PV328_010357 [Microctonus aethiopoides]|uniref:Transposable element P transposase-like RNase H C-terminal domain-containing protein n=1 Tax=Microctonus aethiopoides TaxID=144406 RepID=A0AA39FHN4_9HYME|nr:hypothetical protein PV328_010357 [Microctonus aethiopoides]
MTIRLTQDALEKFFGIMRSACGCNDHPCIMLFSQVYRLLCSYSLAIPPKGSNVTAGELLQSLMQTKDSLALVSAPKNEWLKKLDAIVEEGIADKTASNQNDNGIGQDENLSTNVFDDNTMSDQKINTGHTPFENLLDTTDEDEDTIGEVREAYSCKPFESIVDDSNSDDCENCDNTKNKEKFKDCSDEQYNSSFQDPHHEHDYDVVKSSDEIVAYIAGYMVRKTSRYTKCFTCINTLQSTNKAASSRDKFIESLEEDVLTVVGTKTIKCNTMHQILDKISLRQSLLKLGCLEHTKELMVKIINYFIVMRGHFLTKLLNKNLNQRKLLTRKHRKNAKLT